MPTYKNTPGNGNSALAPHGTLDRFYGQGKERARYVRDLFDRGATEYEWVSRMMSFGTDRRYRRDALRRAGIGGATRVLDVATGTGLVARAMRECGVPEASVVGLDPSWGMLTENRRRGRVSLVQGVGERLPFRDGSFDFVVMGYALRHVEDLSVLFGEFRRILRSAGRVLILEISRPQSRLGCALCGFYMCRLFPFVARLSGRSDVTAELMDYYWATIAGCVPPETIVAALEQAGLAQVRRTTLGPLLSDYVAARL